MRQEMAREGDVTATWQISLDFKRMLFNSQPLHTSGTFFLLPCSPTDLGPHVLKLPPLACPSTNSTTCIKCTQTLNTIINYRWYWYTGNILDNVSLHCPTTRTIKIGKSGAVGWKAWIPFISRPWGPHGLGTGKRKTSSNLGFDQGNNQGWLAFKTWRLAPPVWHWRWWSPLRKFFISFMSLKLLVS